MLHRDTLERMVRKALQLGLALRDDRGRWTVDYSRQCEHPVTREHFSVYDVEKQSRAPNRGPMTVVVKAACRKCGACLKAKGRRWRRAARYETLHSVRTWMGTLTLDPEHHYAALVSCRSRLTFQGVDYDQLSYGEQFRMQHEVHSRELTLFLKRLREASTYRIRYILVCEAHKSGLPHYHMLIHEQDELQPVRYRVLKEQWRQGFSGWKLASDDEDPSYLCKYITKTTAARVRSSIGYGKGNAT